MAHLIRLFSSILFLVVLCLAPNIHAAPVVIKLGTVAPEGSIWHDALIRIRQAWRDISKGEVELRIFPGGVLGGENELVRKLQRRVIDAVTLSGSGLPNVDSSFRCLNIPLLFDTPEQLDRVRDAIAPKIEARLEKQGFQVINWALAGWVYFFARDPVRTPDDLRKQRLWTGAGDTQTERLGKGFGFKVVPLSATEMLTGLQTGMIDAIPAPPLFALLDRSYQVAPYMTDMNWGALNAATIMNSEAWARIPVKLQPELIQSAQAIGASLGITARKAGDDAVREMQSRGLKVITLTEAEQAAWQAEMEKIYPQLGGEYCPDELFHEVMRLSLSWRTKSGLGLKTP